MGKPRKTHARRFALLALLFAVVTFFASAGFNSGYTPSCNHQRMNPGDSCIGTGGGDYGSMVDAHYRDFHIVFWAALAVMLFFTFHSIREFVGGLRARRRARRG
ncbi:hypothetical protein OHA18_39835 [Kribbella sp. NBC_00709]|uniref:hypothetical protein n=1 Tax=Kribbella sp. NBC_00709 TaxID=2975972 RepID=UPI002E2E7EFE|nr:hypothetical protein [Kribbella sp. NBC_00709]